VSDKGSGEDRGLGEKLEEVSGRLERLVEIQQGQGERLERLDGRLERLDGRLERLVEGQTRGFTAVVDAIGALSSRLDNVLLGPLGSKVREHDEAIGELRARVSSLEARGE
jgi:hypothetical protein